MSNHPIIPAPPIIWDSRVSGFPLCGIEDKFRSSRSEMLYDNNILGGIGYIGK